MKRIAILGLLLWLTGFAMATATLSQPLSFRHFGRAEGLSDNAVISLAEDSLGFLWVGTRIGLNRLEGQHFRNYYRSEGGLSGNIINALQRGNDSRMWIGTNQGLCVYDPHTDAITPVEAEGVNLQQEIRSLCCDSMGRLWVIFKYGFCRYNMQSGKCRYYPGDSYSDAIRFLSTRAGDVWFCDWDGILRRYDAARDTFDAFPVLSAEDQEERNFITGMTETATGKIFVATRNHGAYLFSPLTGQVSKVFSRAADGQHIYIHCALGDRHGNAWLGTETGVHVWNEQQGLFVHEQKSGFRIDALADDAVHAFCEDAAGGFWIGTYFGGLCYKADSDAGFIERAVTDARGVPVGNVVREIVPGSGGGLWVSTEDCGVCRMDGPDAMLQSVPLTWQGKAISRNVQTVMDDGKRLWVGTFDEGMYWVDAATMRVTAHFTGSDHSGLSDIAVVHICQTSQGDVLVATMRGLCRYDETDGRFHPIKGLEHGFVHDIFENRNGDLWVASLTGGLFHIKGQGAGMVARKEEIGLSEISTVASDGGSKLYVGTHDEGFRIYDPHTHKLSEPLLPNTGICRFLKDARGHFWITTTRGLYRYQPNDGSLTNFGTSDGLTTDQFSRNSGYVDTDGRIYAGTMAGLVRFNPLLVGRTKVEPVVRFVALQPEGRSLLFTDAVDIDYATPFAVEYAVTCQTTAQPLWVRYRLEGTKADWTVTQDMNPISFNSLSPGHYTLHLQVSNDKTRWTTPERLLHIHMHQPVWWTWWARMFYILAALVIIFITVRLWWRRQQERRRLADEQADAHRYREVLQSKINFFTAITHEIRTPLTLINGSLERLRKRGVKDDIDVMQRNTDRLLALVNQLLDFRKVESSAFLMNFQEVDFTALLREIFENFQPLARQRKVEYTLHTEAETCPVLADREALTKIVSNLLSNALKFCDKRVVVNLGLKGEEIVLKVSNDGPLIPKEEVVQIFKPFHQYYGTSARATINGSGLGLSLARVLAEMHNGSLNYDQHDPTKNTFVLKLKHKPEAEAAAEPMVGQQNDDGSNKPSEELQETDLNDKASQENANQFPTLLLVDDEHDLRQFVSEELAEQYTVIEANNGEEALNILKKKDVALVVTDLMMPVMDGATLCRSIRADVSLCHLPIVVLTAKVSLQDHIDVLNCGADAYIEKPFSTAHLQAQIANLLHSRELLRQTFVSSPYAQPASVASNALDQEFLTHLNKYLNEHLADRNLGVESLAEQMNMSTSTFYRKVKAVTSLSPVDYIRLCRLKRGAELLAGGKLRVKEVADQLGFSSTSYFTTCFMRQFGMTPTEFVKGQRE